MEHWSALDRHGKTVIDMTPAKVGELFLPAINTEQIVKSGAGNIKLMTCGGQAPVPLANANTTVRDEIDDIEVASVGQLVWQASTTLEDGFRGTIEVMR